MLKNIRAGKSHGQWSLVGYRPWGHKELGKTETTEHILSRSGGEKGLRGSGAGTLGVTLEGTRHCFAQRTATAKGRLHRDEVARDLVPRGVTQFLGLSPATWPLRWEMDSKHVGHRQPATKKAGRPSCVDRL